MSAPILTFRSAVDKDLSRLIALLKDDAIAAGRETPIDKEDTAYASAFQTITDDPNNDIIVAEQDGDIVGCLQMTLIPGLGRQGALRLQLETVRVDKQHQNQGVGTALIKHAVDLGRENGVRLVQLTTDKRRTDAHRFYERLGFQATHEGYKMSL